MLFSQIKILRGNLILESYQFSKHSFKMELNVIAGFEFSNPTISRDNSKLLVSSYKVNSRENVEG